jgi:cell division protein FtsQ
MTDRSKTDRSKTDGSNQHGGGLPPEVLGDDIPEAVLDELLVAFADRNAPRPQPATPAPSATPPGAEPPDTPPGAAPPDKPITVITIRTVDDANATPVIGAPPAPPREDAVVVIEADDLPDAVVLDGDPSTGGLGLADGTGAAGRPGVDPRFRARRIAVRRAEGRKRLRWAAIAGIVLLAVVAVLAVLASPLFAIDRVDVDGAVYADPAAIQQVVDSLHGDPILTADLDGAARELEQIPWVEAARVTMRFPNRVTIEIAERTPVASFLGADGQYRVIDADAFVVAVLPNPPADYPPITGVLPNTPAGTGAGAAVKGASQLIAALPPTVADRLASVDLSTNGNLTLQLSGVDGGAPLTVTFGPPNDYRDKLIVLLNRITKEPQLSGTIDVASGDAIVG